MLSAFGVGKGTVSYSKRSVIIDLRGAPGNRGNREGCGGEVLLRNGASQLLEPGETWPFPTQQKSPDTVQGQ